MSRALVLLLLVLGLALPPVAAGQGAFGPLPPADSPPPVETPEPVQSVDDGSSSTRTLLLITGAVILVFVGIGLYITRDARAHLTDDDRRALELHSDEANELERRKQSEAARKKARARAKAQRQARKKQRTR